MGIVAYLEDHFANISVNKFVEVEILDYQPSIILRMNNEYGVGIEVAKEFVVNESFSNFNYHTTMISIGNQVKNFLVLTSSAEHLRNIFAKICALYLEKGVQNIERQKILDDPYSWWSQIKDLIGNVTREKAVHSVLGEMMVYNYLLETVDQVTWSGPNGSSIDIEGITEDYEVKSTINRYKSYVEINSQYQLSKNDKGISLFFCRFEETEQGITIEDMVGNLVSKRVPEHELEEKLQKLGLYKGSLVRNKSYRLLEAFRYTIDDNFPKIVNESFINGYLPENIIKVTYTVDLSGLENEKVDL